MAHQKKLILPIAVFLAMVLVTVVGFLALRIFTAENNFSGQKKFLDGEKIMALVEKQLSYGPRFLGSDAHKQTQEFLASEMERLADEKKEQRWFHSSADGDKNELVNIIGRFYPEKKEIIILATHYDSKKFADKDPDNPLLPVPGANDSASGVAILLEIARFLALTDKIPEIGIDIVFFDGEEGKPNQGADYGNRQPMGSAYLADHLQEIYGSKKPKSGLVLDMVCDKDLRIFKELSSVENAQEQVEIFWKAARNINSNVFQNDIGTEIRDDHTALNQAGIPSFLVIDFEYPYFHTTEDTLDKCSEESLKTVASAILNYVYLIK